MEEKARAGIISNEQKAVMTEYFKTNKQLLSGKFSNEYSFKKAQRDWQDLAATLNAIPGGKKDWKQWRKAWQDMRTRVKSKKAKISKYINGTGGGAAPAETLTATDEMVVELIGNTAIEGLPVISESIVNINIDDVEFLDEGLEEVKRLAPLHIEDNNIAITPVIVAAKDTQNIVINSPTPNKRDVSKHDKPRRAAVQRLAKTISATDELTNIAKQDMENKANFYTRKIQLLEETVELKKRSVKAKEDIAKALTTLARKYQI